MLMLSRIELMTFLTVQLFTLSARTLVHKKRKSQIRNEFKELPPMLIEACSITHRRSHSAVGTERSVNIFINIGRRSKSLPHELTLDDFFLPVYLVTKIKVILTLSDVWNVSSQEKGRRKSVSSYRFVFRKRRTRKRLKNVI